MTPREEAIADCRYALSLGDTALNQHFAHWTDPLGLGDLDYEYHLTVCEISNKIGTTECLLTETHK